MPAPDGKGYIGGRCEGGFYINYYVDKECATEGEMPKEISEGMKGQTSFPFGKCMYMGS